MSNDELRRLIGQNARRRRWAANLEVWFLLGPLLVGLAIFVLFVLLVVLL